MNPIQVDIKRIEFVITNSCSGNCKHCSAITGDAANGSVDAAAAIRAITQLTSRYSVESIMTFGGEPLLYSDTTCQIHKTAYDCEIPVRQIITNGFFSHDTQKIEDVAAALCASGVNNILLSVDAFHQETIPLEPVITFAKALLNNGTPKLRVHPAWVIDEKAENLYNEETRKLLKLFSDIGIDVSDGNNIFPAGNALKYLSEYFPRPETIDLSLPCGQMPYTGRLDEVECVSINPKGDLELCSIVIGNIYENDALTILDSYAPYGNPTTRALLEGGVEKLLEYASDLGVTVDTSDCYSACGICRKTMRTLRR